MKCLPFLFQTKDEECIYDVLSTWKVFSAMDNLNMNNIIDLLPIKEIVDCMDHPRPNISNTALTIVGNLCASTFHVVEIVLKNDAAPILAKLCAFPASETVLRNICWVSANIAACAHEHLDVLVTAHVIERVAALLSTSASVPVKDVDDG